MGNVVFSLFIPLEKNYFTCSILGIIFNIFIVEHKCWYIYSCFIEIKDFLRRLQMIFVFGDSLDKKRSSFSKYSFLDFGFPKYFKFIS